METKKELRMKYKSQREKQPFEQQRAKSAEICGHILGSRLYQEADSIYVYHPLESEVSLLPVIEDALACGRQVAFPKVMGDDMAFFRVESLQQLEEGSFHVMEPTTGIRLEEEDALVFVPGIVFDMDGNRIGYGKGFYDRYLEAHPRHTKLGIAYEAQVVESFEADTRDEKMDYLVTELGIRRIEE